MPSRGCRSVDTDLLEAAAGAIGIEQLVEALQNLRAPPTTMTTSTASYRAPAFDGEGNVELFVKKFKDVADENCWNDRRLLLQLRGSLGSTRIYGRGEAVKVICNALQMRYGISPQQAKERLLVLSRDPQGSVSNFAIEIGHLAKLPPLYLPVTERDLPTIAYLMHTLNYKSFQKRLLTANTSTIAGRVLAIKSYLAIDNSGGPTCKATEEAVGSHHLEQVVSALTTQSVVLARQSEAPTTVMGRLDAIELALK